MDAYHPCVHIYINMCWCVLSFKVYPPCLHIFKVYSPCLHILKVYSPCLHILKVYPPCLHILKVYPPCLPFSRYMSSFQVYPLRLHIVQVTRYFKSSMFSSITVCHLFMFVSFVHCLCICLYPCLSSHIYEHRSLYPHHIIHWCSLFLVEISHEGEVHLSTPSVSICLHIIQVCGTSIFDCEVFCKNYHIQNRREVKEHSVNLGTHQQCSGGAQQRDTWRKNRWGEEWQGGDGREGGTKGVEYNLNTAIRGRKTVD